MTTPQLPADECPVCHKTRMLVTHTRRPTSTLVTRYMRCGEKSCGRGRLVTKTQVVETLIAVVVRPAVTSLATNLPESDSPTDSADTAADDAA